MSDFTYLAFLAKAGMPEDFIDQIYSLPLS